MNKSKTMSQASKKDHISFMIAFIIEVIILIIFFGVLNNSQKEKNLDNTNNSQCCECVKE